MEITGNFRIQPLSTTNTNIQYYVCKPYFFSSEVLLDFFRTYLSDKENVDIIPAISFTSDEGGLGSGIGSVQSFFSLLKSSRT